eukprot:18134-Heterococcus_DN1.PRE.1
MYATLGHQLRAHSCYMLYDCTAAAQRLHARQWLYKQQHIKRMNAYKLNCRAPGPITLSLLPAVALTPCCSCTEPRFIDSRALAAAAVVAVDAPAVALLLE